MPKANVAIIGMGTVGSGVADLLLHHPDRIARNAGRELSLARVVVSDLSKKRSVELPAGLISDDLDSVLNDPSICVVAQVVGGTTIARKIMLQVLAAGKDVVTANKALLAEHGPELFAAARKNNCSIAFEASVCGGVPVISTMSQSLTANQIISLRGILNGTSNYIVTKMDEEAADYESVVKEAQRLGYAEANPAFDVDGSDAAQKLAILAQLGFGADVNWADIPKRGIDSIGLEDFDYARQMGYRIKLIAFAELGSAGLQLSVAPMLVRIGKPLAEVRENYNAVSIVGDGRRPCLFARPRRRANANCLRRRCRSGRHCRWSHWTDL